MLLLLLLLQQNLYQMLYEVPGTSPIKISEIRTRSASCEFDQTGSYSSTGSGLSVQANKLTRGASWVGRACSTFTISKNLHAQCLCHAARTEFVQTICRDVQIDAERTSLRVSRHAPRSSWILSVENTHKTAARGALHRATIRATRYYLIPGGH